MAEQAPAVADRTGIFSLLTAEAVGQVGNMMVIVAGPWFVLETTGSAARTGIVSGALAMGAVIPAVLDGPLVDRLGFKRSSVLADLRARRRSQPCRCCTWPVFSSSGSWCCWCSCSPA